MKTTTAIAGALLAFLTISCSSNEKTNTMIEKTMYGKLSDGREVTMYTLKNSSGSSVSIITYGAIVTSLKVPDRTGAVGDVVIGYDSLQGYVNDKSFFGAIVGRYGNRIGKGRFTLDGKQYQLTLNDGPNHLHGGKVGFYKALWDAKEVQDSAGPSVELTYKSPAGEEGYPGNVAIHVTYTLTNDNGLRIVYEAATDAPTILNPTHHSYFNLSGSFTTPILNELLTIESDSTTPVDRTLIPTGTIVAVDNTPFDFRKPTAIGARINESNEQLQFGKGYDHNWILTNYTGKVRKAAELHDASSGRTMSVMTDQPGLQFYSGNFLDGSAKGKGAAFNYRTALCLEAQHYPDSPNKPQFPSVVLRPGQTYHQTTIYQFSTK